MPNVFMFIKEGLKNFSDGGIYDTELSGHCLKLNELLNDVTVQNYDEHLLKNGNEIRKEIERLNISIRDSLFVDLSEIVILLNDFQLDKQISERDHFYHSIQCFLLSIALFKNFHSFLQPPEDVIAILYSLTMFHDIGYLYKSTKESENKINKYLSDIFLNDSIYNRRRKIITLCLSELFFESNEVINYINDSIKNSKDIADIWSPGVSKHQALSKICNELTETQPDYIKSHAYNGALLLARISMVKSIVLDYCASEFKMDIRDEKIVWIKNVVRAIYNHSKTSFSPLLDKYADFFSFYLITIDELQTYGRQLSKDTRHALINPKDVGFHWDTANPDKLVTDIITKDAELVKGCCAHDCRIIKSKLAKKINEDLLEDRLSI